MYYSQHQPTLRPIRMNNLTFRIKPTEVVSLKPLRHMTLAEYTQTIVPVIKEIRSILKKKYIVVDRFYAFHFFTRQALLDRAEQTTNDTIIENNLIDQEIIDSVRNNNKSIANELLTKQDIKIGKAPHDMVARLEELLSVLYSVFRPDTVCFDWAKFTKTHVESIRSAMDSAYIEDLLKENITFDKIEEIAESVNIRVPKRIFAYQQTPSGITRQALSPTSKLFIDAMDKALLPHKDLVYKTIKTNIDKLLTMFPVKVGDNFPYNCLDTLNPVQAKIIFKFCSMDYQKALDVCSAEQYDNMVLTFLNRVEEKLNVVNSNHNCTSVTLNSTTFLNGVIETNSLIKYSDGLEITNKSSLIYAGGEIQSYHLRYITNFWHDGKKQTQSKLDLL